MKIQLFTGKDKKLYFRIVANNGKTICHSEGYNSKQSRTKTINSLIKNFSKPIKIEQ
jgi:uncharacterized protein YegP (UPF0339 family)